MYDNNKPININVIQVNFVILGLSVMIQNIARSLHGHHITILNNPMYLTVHTKISIISDLTN